MANEAMSRCDRCGGEFSPSQLVTISGKTVCARCKADVVMDVKSGIAPTGVVPPEKAEEIRRKLKKYNLLSFAFALPGFGLQFGAGALMGPVATEAEMQSALITLAAVRIAGVALVIVGLGFYARMKGRSALLSLLGLLSCIGLLVLYFFPKRCHYCGNSVNYRKTQCPACSAPC